MPLSLNKVTLVIYKKKTGSIRFMIMMVNQYLSVIWNILKILKILMITIYLTPPPPDAGNIFSYYEGNEYVTEGGDKRNNYLPWADDPVVEAANNDGRGGGTSGGRRRGWGGSNK